MKKIRTSFEHFFITKHLLKWAIISIPVAAVIGSIVALFLWLLERATEIRWQHSWLLFLLPLAGIFIYFSYKWSGKNAEGGNNLIVDEIHKPGGGVPFRMAPLVLATTVITHFFGGSAGREGTAIQIGGSIASFFARKFNLSKDDIRILLMMGIAAGFGSVFGTPLTGAIFALEVLTVGKINHNALLPCLMASVVANIACKSWGIEHTQYAIAFKDVIKAFGVIHFDVLLLLKVILGGVCFGLAGYLFSELSHTIKNYSNKLIKIKWLIPFTGGCIIIALTYILGTDSYLGLGVTNLNPNSVSIATCFTTGGAGYFSWFWKLLFTAITLSMGFKGGEVTPLFFIGAALGNAVAQVTGAPVDLMAGLGFIAVFAGATNTPVACTIMGVELFGGEYLIYFAIACFTAYYFSGHTGIYGTQRIGAPKAQDLLHHNNKTLHEVRDKRINNKKNGTF
ncbi:voltage-gated chloride channel protein [Arachidicoccus ginsenosidimutans]|uniref:voltage-gated chloride channel family protein n=1 Tax=Arachidicoccus sp. BS20 TaxID=1850526 RepID=UPI0007F06D63|nr:voltage-gated chloride channel family protein [Arachidicoccus sp. BS20]ANI88952.1 voltage-gated chloride channel protein [Arachidicoccus sp. BS20]